MLWRPQGTSVFRDLTEPFKPLPPLAAPAEQHREQQQFHHCYNQSQIAVSREEGPREGPMPWRCCPGAPHWGTSEPTDPLAIMYWEIPVSHTALPLLSLTTSPVLACHHPLQGARSAQRGSRSCYCFSPRLGLFGNCISWQGSCRSSMGLPGDTPSSLPEGTL